MAAGDLWTDDELRASVEAYLFLLSLQRTPFFSLHGNLLQLLRNGPLDQRNDRSVYFRMRNISAVLAEQGVSTLSAYPPAEHVGDRVRRRIEAMLLESPQRRRPLVPVPGAHSEPLSFDAARKQVEEALRNLADAIARLEPAPAGIGHNHPPEALEVAPITVSDIRELRDTVAELRERIASPRLPRTELEQKSRPLAEFGMRCATWIGQRATKGVDTGIKVYVSAYALEAANLLPHVSAAIEAIARLLVHLG